MRAVPGGAVRVRSAGSAPAWFSPSIAFGCSAAAPAPARRATAPHLRQPRARLALILPGSSSGGAPFRDSVLRFQLRVLLAGGSAGPRALPLLRCRSQAGLPPCLERRAHGVYCELTELLRIREKTGKCTY